VNKDKVFRNVGTVQELEARVSCMSEHAKRMADVKMHLSERIESLKHKQASMFA
jgi:hypothetical protein